ncbi:MAG: hypothetical protein JOZ94_22915 [Xanthobacteraceae bacterium]|nr:hypothetical protein [Xanthobacteraceae bacterium]MBV9632014.1 hypothetical protein [Xanthobacteraceae bacterium]
MPSMLSLLYSTEPFEFSGMRFDPEIMAIIRQVFDKARREIHDEGQPTPTRGEIGDADLLLTA